MACIKSKWFSRPKAAALKSPLWNLHMRNLDNLAILEQQQQMKTINVYEAHRDVIELLGLVTFDLLIMQLYI